MSLNILHQLASCHVDHRSDLSLLVGAEFRSHKRTASSQLLENLRLIDAAKDQYAIDQSTIEQRARASQER